MRRTTLAPQGGRLRLPRVAKVAVAVCGVLASTGCGARDGATREDFDAVMARVDELERSNGRLRIRLQDTEERLFLLQDRVEANRINLSRREAPIASAPATQPGAGQGGHRYPSPMTSAAPPPYPNVDPLVASLPVQRVGPPSVVPTEDLPPRWDDDGPEVVIDQAAFEARFGAAPASRGSSSGEPLQAQPPVDVGDLRLSVTTVDNANRPTQPAAQHASPLSIYRSALDQFNEAEYLAALETMNRFVATGPAADYMDNALFWMGECMYGLGRYTEALGFFQRVVSEYPDGNKVPDSLLKEALTYERLDNPPRARDILRVLVDTYPSTDAAERARQRLRDLN